MPYCTSADILNRISEADLIALTDDDDAGVVNAAMVADAIVSADAEIDGYCGSRYPVPFSPAPGAIRDASVDIAIYILFARRRGAPEDRKQRYDARIRYLRDVATAKVSLGGDDPAGTPAASGSPQSSAQDRIFNRTTLAGY